MVSALSLAAIAAQVALFIIVSELNMAGAAAALVALAFTMAAIYHYHRLSDAPSSDNLYGGAETGDGIFHTIDRKLEELQDAQWALSDSAERYRLLLDEHSDMIICRDERDRLTFCNRAFLSKFDITADEVLGTDFRPQVLAIHAAEAEPGAEQISTGNKSLQKLMTAQGPRWIEWTEHPIPTADDAKCLTEITGRDVTDGLEHRRKLREARDQAEQGNRAKSRFLASMSHEIRTPMNGILGMASLLLDTSQSEEQKTYTRAIDQSARNLLSLIDEILDFSKIEAGKLQLKNTPFSIEETIQSVVELMAPAAQEKGLELAWHLDRNSRGTFIGDPVRVRQILLNLVTNAVKFTDRGGIRIEGGIIEPCRTDDSTVSMRVRVIDTGIGMTASDQSRLFSEFEQSDETMRRQSGGTGLGLAISRRLARAMGGEMSVVSKPGEGSVFTVEFNLVSAQRPYPSMAATRGQRDDMRVLLAFDKPMEREALLETLDQFAVSALQCGFDEAFEACDAAITSGQPVTHIVIDSSSNPQTAADLLTHARSKAKAAGCNKEVEGLVLVSVFSKSGLSELRQIGYGTYLVRPVRPSSLREHLKLGPCTPPRQAEKATRAGSENAKKAGKLRLLVAEDNDINALLVEKVLGSAGHHVVRVSDGLAAVEEIRAIARGDKPPYDAILMDVMLPGMDGLEATRNLKILLEEAEPRQPLPPVIALTANAFEEDRENCLAAGLDDYLSKPFDREMLEEVLDRWFASDGRPLRAAKAIAHQNSAT